MGCARTLPTEPYHQTIGAGWFHQWLQLSWDRAHVPKAADDRVRPLREGSRTGSQKRWWKAESWGTIHLWIFGASGWNIDDCSQPARACESWGPEGRWVAEEYAKGAWGERALQEEGEEGGPLSASVAEIDRPRSQLDHEANFCPASDRAVQRDLFPLPIPTVGSSRLKSELSRKSQQRLGKALNKEAMVQQCVIALNDLYAGGVSSPFSFHDRASTAQEAVLSHVRNSVQCLGPPPEGLSRSEALLQLRAFDGYGESQCPCNVKSYQPDLLSLPVCGNHAVPLAELIGDSGGNIVGDFCRSRLRGRNDACEELERSGVKQPYCDPQLRVPRIYKEFVQRLVDADLVELVHEKPVEIVEPFFVGKKDGRLRMVIDCRRSNCWFHTPDRTHLCTAEALSRIDLDEGQQLHISTADLKDAFYHFQLPEELRCYFGMRPIFCEQPSCSQSQSIPRSKLYPRLKVLPMGWNHALFWCQAIHQHVVQQAGATIDTCLEDKAIAPASSMFHIEYVDNFIVLGTSKAQVDEVAAAGVKALRDKGLVVHEEESSHGKIKVLGWEFEDTKLRPLSHRVWRVKLAMERLLEVGRVSGRQLEKVVGHASFICLGRREGLSVFGETYTFIHRHYWSPHRIWSSVRRELQIFCGILPLLWRDLSSPWCAEVTATDASTWGLGATTAVFPQHEVKDLGSFSERWRFEHESYRKPRASTMGAAVCGEGEESEVFNWAATNEHNPSNLEPISFFAKKSIDKKFRNLTLDTVLKPWKVVGRYKWKRQEPMPVLEGRAALYAVKHALRDVNHFHKRHLLLSDSISAVCALDRGRGKSFRLRRVTQQVAALSLCSGCSFHYRWLPSEWNPSDAPSRGSRFPVPLSVLAAHGHPPVDPPAEPTKEEVKTTAGKGNTETKREKQSSDLDWTIRQTAKNRSQKTAVERGGLADSSVSGGCVPEEVPGQLEPSEGHYRFEGPEKHEGECAGPSIVPDAEHHVQRWRRSQSCPVHVSSQFVFQSPPEVLEADGVAFDQADTSGLEEAGPSKGSIAVAVGGRVRPSRVIFPGGTEREGWWCCSVSVCTSVLARWLGYACRTWSHRCMDRAEGEPNGLQFFIRSKSTYPRRLKSTTRLWASTNPGWGSLQRPLTGTWICPAEARPRRSSVAVLSRWKSSWRRVSTNWGWKVWEVHIHTGFVTVGQVGITSTRCAPWQRSRREEGGSLLHRSEGTKKAEDSTNFCEAWRPRSWWSCSPLPKESKKRSLASVEAWPLSHWKSFPWDF